MNCMTELVSYNYAGWMCRLRIIVIIRINNMNKKLLSIAVGSTMVTSLATGVAIAAENPFTMNELDKGDQVAMSIMLEGSCGDKGTEGKCGGDKAGAAKCGADMKKTEGKCGEGRCGGAQ